MVDFFIGLKGSNGTELKKKVDVHKLLTIVYSFIFTPPKKCDLVTVLQSSSWIGFIKTTQLCRVVGKVQFYPIDGGIVDIFRVKTLPVVEKICQSQGNKEIPSISLNSSKRSSSDRLLKENFIF